MIALDYNDRRSRMVKAALEDEPVDQFWIFPECHVIRIGDRFAVLMEDHVGPSGSQMVEIRAVELEPRRGIDELVAKLDDWADPTRYDIADPGIVTWDMGVHVTYLKGEF